MTEQIVVHPLGNFDTIWEILAICNHDVSELKTFPMFSADLKPGMWIVHKGHPTYIQSVYKNLNNPMAPKVKFNTVRALDFCVAEYDPLTGNVYRPIAYKKMVLDSWVYQKVIVWDI